MSDNFEIKSDDIDVQEIMEKIRENIRKRKEQGAYNIDDERLVRSIDSRGEMCPPGLDSLMGGLEKMASIDNYSYSISSHRKIIGPALVRGRRMVNGEVRRYVDPIVMRQSEFNTALINYLRSLDNQMKLLDTDTKEKLDSMKNILARELSEKSRCIDDEMSDRFRRMQIEADQDLNKKRWLANALDKKIDSGGKTACDTNVPTSRALNLNYRVFEDRFRGASIEIKNRQQQAFLIYFRGCKSVLDIGCGRGEFLEILKENGVNGRGIDLDENMVDYCRSKGLPAEKADAIEYLLRINDGSLDGIFIDQVIEHLEPDYLIRMLMLCNRKLSPGSYLVVETVNPVSFVSLANFYIDMTHSRPVHPETMKFLMEYCRFQEITLRFLSPLPEGIILEKIDVGADASEKERRVSELYNKNVDKLNALLYGAQDYAIIGKK